MDQVKFEEDSLQKILSITSNFLKFVFHTCLWAYSSILCLICLRLSAFKQLDPEKDFKKVFWRNISAGYVKVANIVLLSLVKCRESVASIFLIIFVLEDLIDSFRLASTIKTTTTNSSSTTC